MLKFTKPDGSPKFVCNNADCDNNLHSFRPNRGGWDSPEGGCQHCGEKTVDWKRVRARDMNDFETLKIELKKEWIRNEFWEREIDQKSIQKLASWSQAEIRENLRSELEKCVGPAKPFRDGMRVPIEAEKMEGKPFAYVQHATASCCTKCAYYWWGFERDTQYGKGKIDFLTNIGMAYLEDRGVLPPWNTYEANSD